MGMWDGLAEIRGVSHGMSPLHENSAVVMMSELSGASEREAARGCV